MRYSPAFRLHSCIFSITALLISVLAANNSAADEIYSPNVEYHELSFESSGSRSFDHNQNKDGTQSGEFDLEAGLLPRLQASVTAVFSNDQDSGLQLEAREIGARYQFFDQGEHWLDAGLLVAYEFAAVADTPDSLEIKLLLENNIGKFTTTANLGFTQNVGKYAAHTGGPDYVVLSNTRYRYSTGFQPGIELQSDLGQGNQLGHFNRQEHYIGPAVYGKLFGPLPPGQSIKYQMAYLFGASDAASHAVARILIEYETHF